MSANTGIGAGASARPREEALLGALTELMSRWTSADLQARFAVQHGAAEHGAARPGAAHPGAARPDPARSDAAQPGAARRAPALDDAKVRAIYVLGLRGGAARPSELAAELRMTRPTTSKLLARLRADGLLDKRADPADGRATQVELTGLGASVFTQLVDAGHDMVRRALGGWSDTDIEALSSLLSRFVDGLMDEASGMTQADVPSEALGATRPAHTHAPPQTFAPAPAGAPACGATSDRRIPQMK